MMLESRIPIKNVEMVIQKVLEDNDIKVSTAQVKKIMKEEMGLKFKKV